MIVNVPLGPVPINSEATFVFPSSRCCNCGTTKALFIQDQAAVVTAVVCLILLATLSQNPSRIPFIANNLFTSSVAIALTLVFAFYSLRRPSGTQTSFYQPVRISKLDREFVSGAIKRIGFGFTNPVYLREFSKANAAALKAGMVSATKSS